MGYASWGMMIPTQRKKRRNTSQGSERWWSGLVSWIVFINWYWCLIRWIHKERFWSIWTCHTGYKPYAVTHASDNFQQLYDLAVDLIRRYSVLTTHAYTLVRMHKAFIWLGFFSLFLQGSCIRVPPESGGTEGSQCCQLTLERPTCRGVTCLVWEDEEWPVCWRRGDTQDEDGHGGRKTGPCRI